MIEYNKSYIILERKMREKIYNRSNRVQDSQPHSTIQVSAWKLIDILIFFHIFGGGTK